LFQIKTWVYYCGSS